MYVYMYVYMYIFILVYVYIYIYIYICVYIYICMYVCMYVCVCVCVCMCVYTRIKEATPHPPGLDSRIWSWGRLLLELPNPQLEPQNIPTWLQKAPSQAPHAAAQAQRMGRSIFHMVWKGLGWLSGWGPRTRPNMGPTGAKLEPTWGQHGPNLSQLGAYLGPSWIQIGSSKPT